MKIDHGGPAFPFKEDDGTGGFAQFPGMTLRDYFAAKAPIMPEWYWSGWHGKERFKAKANSAVMRDSLYASTDWAWAYADAMLAARPAPQEPK